MTCLDWRVDHIGIACRDIALATSEYQKLGFQKTGPVVIGQTQKVKAQFMKLGEVEIELLEPVDKDSQDNPLSSYLKTQVYKMYHICYRIHDMDAAMEYQKGLHFRQLGPIFPDSSHDQRKAVFMYHRHMGVLELVETCKKQEGRNDK